MIKEIQDLEYAAKDVTLILQRDQKISQRDEEKIASIIGSLRGSLGNWRNRKRQLKSKIKSIK